MDFQWGTPDANSLIYDDELHAVETEQLDAAVSAERARIRNAVAGSDDVLSPRGWFLRCGDGSP